MKKKLEAELISIAHRILKLKNKSELIQLHQEAQKLYEKLSVLRFVEENFGDVKPTIGLNEVEAKLEKTFYVEENVNDFKEEVTQIEKEKTTQEILEEINLSNKNLDLLTTSKKAKKEADKPVIEPIQEIIEETKPFVEPIDVDEALEEKNEDLVTESETTEVLSTQNNDISSDFKPAFELSFDTNLEDSKEEITEVVFEEKLEETKKESTQITFEDIPGSNYIDPVFVKPEDLNVLKEMEQQNVIPIGRTFTDFKNTISINKNEEENKLFSLNDRLTKGIIIGLNDRVAFMKNLFDNNSDDFNRVLSQLITFHTFDEAKHFIEEMVKPDYNNWDGKEEYEERFMEIVERKFN